MKNALLHNGLEFLIGDGRFGSDRIIRATGGDRCEVGVTGRHCCGSEVVGKEEEEETEEDYLSGPKLKPQLVHGSRDDYVPSRLLASYMLPEH